MKKSPSKILKLNDPSLVKLFVQRIVYDDGFERHHWRGISHLQLKPTKDDKLELWRDGILLGSWALIEEAIAQLPPLLNSDGSFKANRSPPAAHYVIGKDGRRYRHLYFQQLPNAQFTIGTRTDLGLKFRYPNNCLSKTERTQSPEAIVRRIMRERKYRRRERKVLRGAETTRDYRSPLPFKKQTQRAVTRLSAPRTRPTTIATPH
jgi:hypothetical protein